VLEVAAQVQAGAGIEHQGRVRARVADQRAALQRSEPARELGPARRRRVERQLERERAGAQRAQVEAHVAGLQLAAGEGGRQLDPRVALRAEPRQGRRERALELAQQAERAQRAHRGGRDGGRSRRRSPSRFRARARSWFRYRFRFRFGFAQRELELLRLLHGVSSAAPIAALSACSVAALGRSKNTPVPGSCSGAMPRRNR
jgi:hypothetical protein